jgi:hypothetical protein
MIAKGKHVLSTYSEYINRFLTPDGLGNRPCPGEHHFVSAYLVPRLYALNRRVPDYINPDGTKGINGDVVYYQDGQHQFGIEVKLGTVRLTKGEFNKWIVSDQPIHWPHTFLGIGVAGIGVCPWEEFRLAYINAVADSKAGWAPKPIVEGYGPMKSVNSLLKKLPDGRFFARQTNVAKAAELEESFIKALSAEVAC